MRFKNSLNGHIEEVSSKEWLWVLLFDSFYFATKKVWSHTFIGFFCALMTWGVSWLIYPFFAKTIMRNHYLREGWIKERLT